MRVSHNSAVYNRRISYSSVKSEIKIPQSIETPVTDSDSVEKNIQQDGVWQKHVSSTVMVFKQIAFNECVYTMGL